MLLIFFAFAVAHPIQVAGLRAATHASAAPGNRFATFDWLVGAGSGGGSGDVLITEGSVPTMDLDDPSEAVCWSPGKTINCGYECEDGTAMPATEMYGALETGSGVGVGSGDQCSCSDYRCFPFFTEHAEFQEYTEVMCDSALDATSATWSPTSLPSACSDTTYGPKMYSLNWPLGCGYDGCPKPALPENDDDRNSGNEGVTEGINDDADYDSLPYWGNSNNGYGALEDSLSLDDLLVEATPAVTERPEFDFEKYGGPLSSDETALLETGDAGATLDKSNWRHDLDRQVSMQMTTGVQGMSVLSVMEVMCNGEIDKPGDGGMRAWITSCFLDVVAACLPGPWKLVLDIAKTVACAAQLVYLVKAGIKDGSVWKNLFETSPTYSGQTKPCVLTCMLIRTIARMMDSDFSADSTWDAFSTEYKVKANNPLFAKLQTGKDSWSNFKREGKAKQKIKAKGKKAALSALRAGFMTVMAYSCKACCPCFASPVETTKGENKGCPNFISGCLGSIGANIIQYGMKAGLAYFTAMMRPEQYLIMALKLGSNAIPGAFILKILGPCLIYGAKLAIKAAAGKVKELLGSRMNAEELVQGLVGDEDSCEHMFYQTICHPEKVNCYPSEMRYVGGFRLKTFEMSGIKHWGLETFCAKDNLFGKYASTQAQQWIGKHETVSKCLKWQKQDGTNGTPDTAEIRRNNGLWKTVYKYECLDWAEPVQVVVEKGVFHHLRDHNHSVCFALKILQEYGLKSDGTPCDYTNHGLQNP